MDSERERVGVGLDVGGRHGCVGIAGRERELREAHRLFTEIGATGHAQRLAQELDS